MYKSTVGSWSKYETASHDNLLFAAAARFSIGILIEMIDGPGEARIARHPRLMLGQEVAAIRC